MATAVEVTVRYFAAAKAAAGAETGRVAVPPGATLDDLIATLGRDNADLAKVLVRCSFLRDGVAVRDHAQRLAPGVTVDVLPPFAGG
jgi:sulfur-carrier protein